MQLPRRLTDAELAEVRRRRPGVRASLACEGMTVPPATEALFEQFDQQRLTMEQREERLLARSRATRAAMKAHAAE